MKRGGFRASGLGPLACSLLLILFTLLSGGAIAQASQNKKPAKDQQGSKQAQAAGQKDENSVKAGEATKGINKILEGEEEVLEGGGYTYDPGGRRDPFKSLLGGGSAAAAVKGPRPKGVPGLLIDEIDLSGIFITPQGPVAQVQASNKKESYLLRVGDHLYDGEVVNITSNEVVFRQKVNDPTALKPFREVVKKLNP
ncbi:MAG TPA: hypothetical protein VKA53_01345 [Thermoanaerobaculia bacterium]|nr:hypothetical protein [Thermoanaerobaculia bacterium]